MEKINIKRIKAWPLFKLVFIGGCIVCVPISILEVIFKLISVAEKNIYSIVTSVMLSPVIGISMAIVISIFFGFAFIGLWVYSKFRTLELELKPAE